jgi:hypothetical protein
LDGASEAVDCGGQLWRTRDKLGVSDLALFIDAKAHHHIAGNTS